MSWGKILKMYPKYPGLEEINKIHSLNRYIVSLDILAAFILMIWILHRNHVLDLSELIDVAPFTINVKASVEVSARSYSGP